MAAENERLSEQHRRETDREGAGFQRETLIELQDWLVRLARVTALIYQQHELEYRRTGAWGRERLGGSLNVEFHEAIRNVRRYSVRVRDDEVRREAKQLVELCVAGVLVADGRDEDDEVARRDAAQALEAAYALNDVLNDHIGQRLRELFCGIGRRWNTPLVRAARGSLLSRHRLW
jgi:hypothetical protein